MKHHFARREFIKLGSTLLAGLALAPLTGGAERPGKEFLVQGVAKAGTPGVVGAPSDANTLRFLVIGDWGKLLAYKSDAAGVKRPSTTAGAGQLAVARAMARWAGEHRPAFVLSVGDNFYETGVKSVDDPRWKLTFEDVYAAASLQVPWYVALGNHDHYGNFRAQLDYTSRSNRWRMPARHYSFTEKSGSGVSAEVFVLDTEAFARSRKKKTGPDAEFAAEQLDWLEKALGASKADWKIVVGHHPLRTGGERRLTREHDLDKVLPAIFRRHGVAVYLCGHEHDAQHLQESGVHCLLVGNGAEGKATGVIEQTVYAEAMLGFAHAEVTKSEFRLHYVNIEGVVRHTATIGRPTAKP